MKPSLNKKIASVGIALILMPEPFTTVVGAGLLTYAKLMQLEENNGLRRCGNMLDYYYTCRLEMVGNGAITCQMLSNLPGQLPKNLPGTPKLYSVPETWESLQEAVNQNQRVNSSSASKPKVAGLLRAPHLKARLKA